MMNAALIVGLVVLLIHGSHCQPQLQVTFSALQSSLEAVQFLMTSSINKRQSMTLLNCNQSELQDFLRSIPQDCASQIAPMLSSSRNRTMFDSAALMKAYRLICQPRCRNPLITFYSQCELRFSISLVRGICTRNNAGRPCYDQIDSILSDAETAILDCFLSQFSNCTTRCQNTLDTWRNNSGCCINALNITGFVWGYRLWSHCSVDTPGRCNLLDSFEAMNSTEMPNRDSAEAPAFERVLILLTLVVVAMLLL